MIDRHNIRLLEALVAATVIGFLVSLVAPALIRARESSRSNTCGQNLAAIGSALQEFTNSHQVLPAIGSGKKLGMWIPGESGSILPDTKLKNWVSLILPYLADERETRSLEQWGRDPGDIRRYSVQSARLRCPSDPYNGVDNLYMHQFARGNYAINAGPNYYCISPGTAACPCLNGFQETTDSGTGETVWYGDGISGYNKTFRLSEFVAGLSYVVAVDEIRAGIHDADSRGVWGLGLVGSSVTFQHGLYGDDCGPNNPWPRSDDIYGCGQITEELGQEKLAAENMPCCWYIKTAHQATARSKHQGGVHCLMLDGSWHFVPDDVSQNIWHVMHSRENRQMFSLPWRETEVQSAIAASEGPKEAPKSDRVSEREVQAFTNTVNMRFVRIPSGEFMMGLPDQGREQLPDEKGNFWVGVAPHVARISKPFYIDAFETTQEQFRRVMGYNPSFHAAEGQGSEEVRGVDTMDYPVENVSWDEAQEYCKRLTNQIEEQSAGRRYRLPTEAEWEYVCRGGSSTGYRLRKNRDPDEESGDNAGKEEGALPIQRVGMYAPNAFGVCDMRGNVWEWCQDWYARDYYAKSPKVDPQGPETGVLRVIRGSDWAYSVGPDCRLTQFPMPQWRKHRYVGFRVICEIEDN